MLHGKIQEIPKKGRRRMKKLFACLLCFFCLFSAASADQVSFGSVSFDQSAEYIDMGSQEVRDYSRFIAFLKEFPNLKKVDMFATKIKEEKVDLLREALPDVEFGWYLEMMYYHFIRSDAEAYSTLHGIHPKHPSREFALLKYCTNLKALDLGHNDLTDISFLSSMPHLKVLILGDNRRMKNIEEVGKLEELEYLELFSCGITDISPLKNLRSLMDLNLCNNKVKDWRVLKEMTWLKRLWISGMCTGVMTRSELTKAERQELQEALPDTEIVFKGQPTDYGWREDPKTKEKKPHYKVVYEIFHTDTYIPFEDSVSFSVEDDAPADGTSADDGILTTEDLDPSELPDPGTT